MRKRFLSLRHLQRAFSVQKYPVAVFGKGFFAEFDDEFYCFVAFVKSLTRRGWGAYRDLFSGET